MRTTGGCECHHESPKYEHFLIHTSRLFSHFVFKMKLDVNALRYLSKDDFRVLTSVEMGQKNHEIVPLQLIDSISGLKHGGAFKCIKILLRHKLLHHDGSTYDGYR